MMNRGFLSFVLGAVFLLSIVSAGISISRQAPDYSYEKYRAMLVQEVAIKRAYYDAVAEAANNALALSLAASEAGAESDPRLAVRAAALARTEEFALQLQAKGYDAIFWCGDASERQRQEASQEMAARHKAVLPQGALPLESCADSFDADVAAGKIYFRNTGFSFYNAGLGMGEVAVLPATYSVDFHVPA